MQLSPQVLLAFGLILTAAAMNGAYAIPLRFMTRWKWENAWAVWTVLAMMVLPIATAIVTIPRLGETYAGTSPGTFALMGVFGALWGAGVLMIGMSFPLVGVAVGNAVALGSAAALGSLLPLFGRQADKLGTRAGNQILLGVAVLLAGVAVCGLAGRERERRQGVGIGSSQRKAFPGFLLALVGGSLTALLNIALAYGSAILDAVRTASPGSTMAANAVWVPVLFAGALPGLVYCLWLLRRNHSLAAYGGVATTFYWPLIVLMAALWFGSVLLYGVGALRIGSLGPVVGWPVFMSGAVIASFAWGALAGEWKQSGPKAVALMMGGIALLVAAMALFAKAAA